MPKSLASSARWFQITNLAAQNSAEIRLTGYIGESKEDYTDWWTGNRIEGQGAGTVKEFQRDLDAVGNVQNLRVVIASQGGNAWDALAIHNMLSRHPARITCVIDGFAFSAATLIAMAADVIEMPRNALMMIHNSEWVAIGDKGDMQAALESLKVMDMAIAKSYAGKSGRKPEDFLPLMEAETWMDGDEAKALGLVDVVTAAQSITAHVSSQALQRVPEKYRARFDTVSNPNPTNHPTQPMLRPRTPLFNAATDTPPAGGGAAPAQPAASAPAPSAAPALAATPQAATPPPPQPAAQPSQGGDMAAITNAVNAGITAAIKPLQDQLAAQQQQITNLQQLHTHGAATAAQGAPAVGQPAPAAAADGAPQAPTADQMKNMSALQLIALGRQMHASGTPGRKPVPIEV